MTREEQIAKAAFDFGSNYPKGVKHDSIIIDECFRAGAKWADEHPHNTTEEKSKSDDIIEIVCNECGNLFKCRFPSEQLVWEELDANERELGTERYYEAKFICNCTECNKQLVFTCQVWEYPEGKIDYQDIVCDNAQVVSDTYDLELRPFEIESEDEER